jgi:NTE family protein
MIAHQRGEAIGVLRDCAVPDLADGPLPPRPQLRVGSPPLMLAALLTPHRVHPWVGASAWLPRGRGQHVAVRTMVQALHAHAHQHSAPQRSLPDWVDRQTWIAAVDYHSGRRVIFGREGAPRARLDEAVVASCSVRSATSLGVLARADVDEIYVLAPMASTVTDRPRKAHERLERRLRRLITAALLREAHTLRGLGIRVTVLTPGPEDLAAMGVNLMDPRRRTAVLETSLRTSAAALTGRGNGQPQVA